MPEDIPPSVLGGMVLLLHSMVPAIAKLLGPVGTVLERIGAGRSQAFEMRKRLLELIPSLLRDSGRPRRPPAEERSLLPVIEVCFDYATSHPGAISARKERKRYSDGYRRFVVELASPGGLAEGLPLPALSRATRVPEGTLKNWLSPPPGRGKGAASSEDTSPKESAPAEEDGNTERPEPDTDAKSSKTVRDVRLQQLFALWNGWQGEFVAFCNVARQDYRLPFGMSFIRDALEGAGLRTRERRGAGQAPWTRDTYVTYFPGAQWIGDGTSIAIWVLGQVFVFNVEAILDVASNALVGLNISDVEDAEAVRKAYESGLATTGSPPAAVTLDNRPSNHSPGATEALAGATVLRSTPGRGESKAPIEGAFGLFRQSIPPLVLDGESLRDLARGILEAVLTAWSRGRNGRPRRRLDGRSPADAYREAAPTPEDLERVASELRERQRRQQKAARTLEARRDPVRLGLLNLGLEELGIRDPEGSLSKALAYYSRDAITYGLATFRTKRDLGTLPPGLADPGRYLGGIIRNSHEKRELFLLSEYLLEQRLRQRDICLEPLTRRAALLRREKTPCDLPASYADQALKAKFDIDFRFWAGAAAEALSELPEVQRPGQYRRLCGVIAGTFETEAARRDHLVDRLATAMTLAA